jgi:hypothetical protein
MMDMMMMAVISGFVQKTAPGMNMPASFLPNPVQEPTPAPALAPGPTASPPPGVNPAEAMAVKIQMLWK